MDISYYANVNGRKCDCRKWKTVIHLSMKDMQNLDTTYTKHHEPTYSYNMKSTTVIIKSPDMNLAGVNPVKLRKLQNDITINIRKVIRFCDGIVVECFNAKQAEQVLSISTLGSWSVKCEYSKAETLC